MAFVAYVTRRFLRGAVSSDSGPIDPICPSLIPTAMPLSDTPTLLSPTFIPNSQ